LFDSNYITPWRLALVVAFIAVASGMTLTDWGAWAAIVAASIALLLFLWGIRGWSKGKQDADEAKEDVAKHRQVRKQLALYLKEGQGIRDIIGVCPNGTNVAGKEFLDSFKAKMNEWDKIVGDYIKENCGEEEEELFRNSNGLIPRFTATEDDPDQRKTALTYLGFRLQRLHELIARWE
jgi:hypothetical protein